MHHRAPLYLVGMFALACAAIWALVLMPAGTAPSVAGIEPAWLAAALATDGGSSARVAALLAAQPAELTLGLRTQSAGCSVRGPLPDPLCSPGAVFADAGTSTICVAGYTKAVRNVPTKLKRQLYAAYGISYPQAAGSYELDHLIPLELGGSNDAANLFPEAAASTSGQLGFKEKDVVEDYLHDEVCAGRLHLAQAQKQIATDWVAVYKALDEATISDIKQRYRSWAN